MNFIFILKTKVYSLQKSNRSRNRFCILLAIFLIISTQLFSLTFTATGTGATETEAREDALSSLASMMYSRVKSESIGTQILAEKKDKLKKNEKTIQKSITVTTDVPLFGVTYKKSIGEKTKYVEVTATIDSVSSIPLYEAELNKIVNELETLFPSLGSASIRESAAVLYDDYERLASVALLLQSENIPLLSVDRKTFDETLLEYSNSENSLKAVAETLTKNLKQKKIYVYPASFGNVEGVSDFSYALQQYIIAALGTLSAPTEKKASYYFSGTYIENRKDASGKQLIDISYRLVSKWGNVVEASPLVTILPEALEGRSYYPAGYEVQKELSTDTISSSEFFADIRVNGQKNGLVFNEGESLKIEVKASEPCLLYIIGYVFGADEKSKPFAYLFPFEISKYGKEMFVKHISSGYENTWVSANPTDGGVIQEIEIIPPFGSEALQVFAVKGEDMSTFVKRIPSYRETDDYYIVGNNASDAIGYTRALNVKKVVQNAVDVQCCEASIVFMTHK